MSHLALDFKKNLPALDASFKPLEIKQFGSTSDLKTKFPACYNMDVGGKPLQMKQCGSCFAYFIKRGPHTCEPGKIQLVERSIRGMRGMLLPC